MSRLIVSLFAVTILILPRIVFAHTHWTSPVPRVNENIKMAPCGAGPGAISANYNEGDAITVTYDEFIQHNGFFRVAVSTNPNPTDDTDFTPLANPLPAPTTNPYPLFMDPLTEIYDTHTLPNNIWTLTFQLPTGVNCTDCVLQVIEYMMDAGASVTPTLYHSCADVSIKATTDATQTGGGSSTTTTPTTTNASTPVPCQ
jgi:hypothetical protein